MTGCRKQPQVFCCRVRDETEDGNKYRVTLPDIIQSVMNLVTLSPKWDAFIKSLSSEVREP